MKLLEVAHLEVTRPRILVLFPGALGDFVCFLPALETLARRSEVDLFARTDYAGLVPENVATHTVESATLARLFVANAAAEVELRDFFESYGEVYTWMGSQEAHFVRNLQALASGKLRVFPFFPPPAMHATHYYLRCVDHPNATGVFPVVSPRSDAVLWSRWFWQQNGLEDRRVLAIAPGSGAKEKNWPVEFYQTVAQWWEREAGGRVLILWGPAEEERHEARRLRGYGLPVRGLDLPRLAALLARSALYLGNDSGISHLAAAVGVSTVAIFGPTEPAQWAPSGKGVVVVRRGVACSPCDRGAMKACLHRKCLTELRPESIRAILKEALESSRTIQRARLHTILTGPRIVL